MRPDKRYCELVFSFNDAVDQPFLSFFSSDHVDTLIIDFNPHLYYKCESEFVCFHVLTAQPTITTFCKHVLGVGTERTFR